MLYAVYNFRLFFGYDYVIFRDAFIFTFAWMQPSGCHFIRSFVPLFYRVACFELHTNILTEREREHCLMVLTSKIHTQMKEEKKYLQSEEIKTER